tara:strand:+ start:298 stop:1347 length:1050 start_codon:yes stop_codon:yes gene_type:complete
MKEFTHIVGTRPQIIKLSAVITKKNDKFNILDTNQHFDKVLQKSIYENLKIDIKHIKFLNVETAYSNNISILTNLICSYLLKVKNDHVIVYGDTNTTVAGALAAKLSNKVLIHVESGLRSGEVYQVEEANRKIVDALSDYRLCPTESSITNLKAENFTDNNFLIGDLTLDVFKKNFREDKNILDRLKVTEDSYYISTIHRKENTEEKNKLQNILESLNTLENLLLILHPSLIERLSKFQIDIKDYKNIKGVEPLTYTDMLNVVNYSKGLVTDSGGLQKDGYWLNKKIITLRNNTEWKETLINQENILISNYPANLNDVMNKITIKQYDKFTLFGDGNASNNLLNFLKSL